jgi:hypothetical protein
MCERNILGVEKRHWGGKVITNLNADWCGLPPLATPKETDEKRAQTSFDKKVKEDDLVINGSINLPVCFLTHGYGSLTKYPSVFVFFRENIPSLLDDKIKSMSTRPASSFSSYDLKLSMGEKYSYSGFDIFYKLNNPILYMNSNIGSLLPFFSKYDTKIVEGIEVHHQSEVFEFSPSNSFGFPVDYGLEDQYLMLASKIITRGISINSMTAVIGGFDDKSIVIENEIKKLSFVRLLYDIGGTVFHFNTQPFLVGSNNGLVFYNDREDLILKNGDIAIDVGNMQLNSSKEGEVYEVLSRSFKEINDDPVSFYLDIQNKVKKII